MPDIAESPVRQRRIAAAVVLALAFFAFTPALANRYAFDDNVARPIDDLANREHRLIIDLHPPWEYFRHHYWSDKQDESRLYRPITIWSYSYTYHLLSRPFGDLPESWPYEFLDYTQKQMDGYLHREALPHHAINMLLNGWAALLVLWLMMDLGVCLVGATLAAALFAVHSLHSEVVAGIVGRAELFAFCFGLFGVRAYRRAEDRSSRGWFAIAAVAFFMALGSKESAIAWFAFLPCYLLVRGWRRESPEAWRSVLGRHRRALAAVLLPPLLLFLTLRGIVTAGMSSEVFYEANPLFYQSLGGRLMSAVTILGYALYKCVWPFSLACAYGPNALPTIESALDPRFLASAAGLAACLYLGLRRPARRPLLFLIVLVFFGFSFVTSNIPLAIGTVFGERLYYAPSLALCIAPALLMSRLSVIGRRVLVAACIVWMGACVTVDFQRSKNWKDNEFLMLHDADAQPECASLQVKAAGVRRWLMGLEPDKRDEHLAEYHSKMARAELLDPGSIKLSIVKAEYLVVDGKPIEAIAELRRALQKERLPISGSESAVRSMLATLLLEHQGDRRAALDQLRMVMEKRPEHRRARFDRLSFRLGTLEALDASGDPHNDPAVVERLGQVLSLLGEHWTSEGLFVDGRIQLGRSLARMGRAADARRELEMVVGSAKASDEHKASARRILDTLD